MTGFSIGQWVLATGHGGPNLRRQRPVGLDRLWVGQPAESWPSRVAAVFSLCGHAQRLTATRALQAARGVPGRLGSADRQGLRWATVRDQMRRLLLDAPDAAPIDAAHRARSLTVLRAAPLDERRDPAEQARQWNTWLSQQVLQMPAKAWLQRADEGGEAWLLYWCRHTDTPLAQWLAHHHHAAAPAPRPVAEPLCLQDDPGLQHWLAERLGGAEGAAFAAQPEGPAGPMESGPWARAADPFARAAHNAWMRTISRLRDAVLLCHDGGEHRLDQGALPLGERTGLAWTEMARGLLVHWVRLEPAPEGGEQVAACRTVSPTDWNGHPRGGLARALAAMSADAAASPAAEALVLAFDPCVPVLWRAAPLATQSCLEPGHA